MNKKEFSEKIIGKTFYSDLHKMYWVFKDENTLVQQRIVKIEIEEISFGEVEINSLEERTFVYF